jgi:hypothetical protein
MRERMSVVVKKGVRAILGLHPWTAHVMRCAEDTDQWLARSSMRRLLA